MTEYRKISFRFFRKNCYFRNEYPKHSVCIERQKRWRDGKLENIKDIRCNEKSCHLWKRLKHADVSK